MASPICLRLLAHLMRAAASRTFWTAGRSRPIRMAMMAMTTSSSISVKPPRRFMLGIPRGRWRGATRLGYGKRRGGGGGGGGGGAGMGAFAELERCCRETRPAAAIVLGSGLGPVAERVRPLVAVPYSAVPGLLPSSVPGHRGALTLGTWAGRRVLLFEGRLHHYEG